MKKQFCIYTKDFKQTPGLFRAFREYDIVYEPHINRTRFWLHSDRPLHQKFYIRFSTHVHCVDHETDHTTGT